MFQDAKLSACKNVIPLINWLPLTTVMLKHASSDANLKLNTSISTFQSVDTLIYIKWNIKQGIDIFHQNQIDGISKNQ